MNTHDENDFLEFTFFDGHVRGDPSFSLSLEISVTINKKCK